MAEIEHLQKNDVGTYLRMVIRDEDGQAVDLTTATTVQEKIYKPATTPTTMVKDAVVEDAVGGIIYYITVSGDLDVAGLYQIQAYIEMPAWTGHSNTLKFYVDDNLS